MKPDKSYSIGMPDDMDGILASEEELVPASGFAARVMEAVHDAAAMPPPLRFPWGRFLLGALACLGWAAAAGLLVAGIDATHLPATITGSAAVAPCLAYAVGALLLTWVIHVVLAKLEQPV